MKKLVPIIALLTAMSIFTLIGGCGLIESQFAKLTYKFKVLPTNNRVLYEEGARKMADAAARYLPQAIHDVEAKQYGKFTEPIKIYAFASSESFSKFTNQPEVVKGAGYKNEIYLSGKLLNIMGEVQGMLTHELSHVQLTQQLGVIKFNRTLPRWFREGLAIYVSNGGGATNASEAETIEHFLQGKHFIPETEGALINQRLHGTYKIEPKIFYRQSGDFVKYLAHSYPLQFKVFIEGIQNGKQF